MMAKIKKVNHVAIAVPDINNALSFWRDMLGLNLHHIEEVPSQKSIVAFLPVGDGPAYGRGYRHGKIPGRSGSRDASFMF
jgi:catechol 2,3-dioxygenase-like lactoylglutathione lyase family enzyme